jgi:hypothetical protein
VLRSPLIAQRFFRFGWPREQAQAHRRLTDHLPNGKWKETTISPSIIYQLA